MIRLQRVSKVFGEGPARVPALSDVSFGVDKGEFAILTGASGAGKTTLLRLLYRDELPTEGEVEVAGFDVATLRRSEIPRLRRSIGIVFQDAKLLAGRTVFENVAFVLPVLRAPPARLRRAQGRGAPGPRPGLPEPAFPGRSPARLAGARHRQGAGPAAGRRAHGQPRRGDGGRDPGADQGHRQPRHHGPLRHAPGAPRHPAQAPHAEARGRAPR